MRLRFHAAFLCILIIITGPAQADEAAQALVKQFLGAITPPGADISFAAMEESDGVITVRDVVAHAQSAGGEETIQRIGQIQVRGLEALPSGLFRASQVRAENIRIDGAPDLQSSGSGNVRIATITASGVNGGLISSFAASGISLGASAGGGAYAIRIASATVKEADTQSLTRAVIRAHSDPQSARLDDALMNSLLNSNSYGALHLRGLSVSKGGIEMLSLAELNSEPDGAYAPFPASGRFSIRNASLDLRDPMAAALRQWLGQDKLRFDLESRHIFSAPASHDWDATLKLSPDAALSGVCKAQNLNGFTSALIQPAQAAASSAATLRSCNLNFTGAEFVNRWLAHDGAKQGLTAEQARAKYLAGSLYVSLDPQTASNPMAVALSEAMMIFLSQPSRLNIQLAPPGGLKFPELVANFAMLMQGDPGAKQQAMRKLGLNISAVPLN